jgi:hypothetical protein
MEYDKIIEMNFKILIICCLILVKTTCFAQKDTITTQQAKNFIDKEIVLKGKLMNIKEYTDRKGDLILFLDIDEKFPNTLVGVTVFSNAREELKLSQSDIGKTFYFSGVIEMYRDKPTLQINMSSQVIKKE